MDYVKVSHSHFHTKIIFLLFSISILFFLPVEIFALDPPDWDEDRSHLENVRGFIEFMRELDDCPDTKENKDIINIFRNTPIYREFKWMYPESIEFMYKCTHTLEIEQRDQLGNFLVLDMSLDKEENLFYYIYCLTERWIKTGGPGFAGAFDYLRDNECLLEYDRPTDRSYEDHPSDIPSTKLYDEFGAMYNKQLEKLDVDDLVRKNLEINTKNVKTMIDECPSFLVPHNSCVLSLDNYNICLYNAELPTCSEYSYKIRSFDDCINLIRLIQEAGKEKNHPGWPSANERVLHKATKQLCADIIDANHDDPVCSMEGYEKYIQSSIDFGLREWQYRVSFEDYIIDTCVLNDFSSIPPHRIGFSRYMAGIPSDEQCPPSDSLYTCYKEDGTVYKIRPGMTGDELP